ncbi:MAG TPA: protein kinase [Thermoanaerobaculia bacterium]|nr:protein kinase [Thermoanaerobaculia bacterium]
MKLVRTSLQLTSGTRLGPYEIVAPIGAGGMGEVYRARDTRLERQVAIKVLPEAMASSPDFRQRFEREARTISSLNHPHICTLYDVGQAAIEGSPSTSERSYLVMEYLEGETLADRLDRGPLPLKEVLKIGAQLADALARAHRAGITHRDLKPGNIMLTRSGAKLLDFGLAKIAAPNISTEALTEKQKPLTAEGTILGTFQYMAPEQLEGLEADGRTDIFALGVVLYEMTTGRRAFEGKTRTSLIASIVASEPIPINELQPLAPQRLQQIIAKCLEKDPDRRWQSSYDIAEILSWIGSEADSSPDQRGKSWTVAFAGLGLLAALALGALVRSWLRPTENLPAVVASIRLQGGVEILRPEGNGAAVVISPDGKFIVFTGKNPAGKGQLLWLRSTGSREARQIQGTDAATYPFWSHDSRWIAFFANGKLRKVALDGSPPLTVCEVASSPLSGDWGSDDTILFSPASGAPIHRVSAYGGKSVAITTLDVTAGETTHRWARFLPDNKGFLYLAGSHDAPVNSEINAIYATRLGSPDRKLILRTRFNFEYSAGHLLFVRGTALFTQRFDPSRLELQGEPRQLVKEIDVRSAAFFASHSMSDQRALVYVAGAKERQQELVSLDATGRELAKVLEPGNYAMWAISPDGRTVALSIDDSSVGLDIWLQDLARGGRTRLTLGGTGGEPIWSPDGTRIAWESPGYKVNVKRIEGDPTVELLWKSPTWAGPTAWSPDGRHIAVWSFDPKKTGCVRCVDSRARWRSKTAAHREFDRRRGARCFLAGWQVAHVCIERVRPA